MGQTIMPHSTETESALIGSLLINPDCRAEVSIQVPKEAFYSEAHSQIYEAILESNGGDAISVINLLGRKGVLAKVGGADYVASMAMNVWTSVGVKYYSEELTALHKQRLLIAACNRVISKAKDGAMPDEMLAVLRADLRAIDVQGDPAESPNYRDTLKAVMSDIEDRMENGNRNVGILTGYETIDGKLMGMEPKTLTYLIGRPSMGKTALALNIADNMAASDNGLILFFSLEMSSEALARRTLAAESKVFLSRIRAGDFETGQLDHLLNAVGRLYDRDIYVLDHPTWKTIEMMVPLAEKICGEKKVAAIFVDHLQLMKSSRRFNNRHLEISHISNELKSMSKTLDVPVIALSQLSRKMEDRTPPLNKPQLSDMKESGDLEQDADIVIAVHRKDKEDVEMHLAGLKGRDTGTWRGKLHFNRFTQKISDWREDAGVSKEARS